jgi:hypothetical protein
MAPTTAGIANIDTIPAAWHESFAPKAAKPAAMTK